MAAVGRELRSKTQPRRGLRRQEAAIYIGISATKFDDWVRRGLMPKPKHQDDIVVWDQYALDCAFEALPDDGIRDESSWD